MIIPPKTETIDVEWSGFLDEEPTIPGIIPQSVAPDGDALPPDSERPTRVPAEPIENIARRLMAELPPEEEQRALSSPRFPAISVSPASPRGAMETLVDEAAGTYDRPFENDHGGSQAGASTLSTARAAT